MSLFFLFSRMASCMHYIFVSGTFGTFWVFSFIRINIMNYISCMFIEFFISYYMAHSYLYAKGTSLARLVFLLFSTFITFNHFLAQPILIRNFLRKRAKSRVISMVWWNDELPSCVLRPLISITLSGDDYSPCIKTICSKEVLFMC